MVAYVRIACFETFHVELQDGDFVMGTIGVTMPKMPSCPSFQAGPVQPAGRGFRALERTDEGP